MGHRKKSETNGAEQTGHNGNGTLDRVKTREFVSRIENLHGDLDTLRSEHMTACKGVREDIAEIYTEAKDTAGITKRALKAKVAERLLRKKADRCRDDLEAEQLDMFDALTMALGELDDERDGPRQTMAQAMREPGAPLASENTAG